MSDTINQQTLNALRLAGKMLAPILSGEVVERSPYWKDFPSIHFSEDGRFTFHQSVSASQTARGQSDKLDEAYTAFLADKQEKLAAVAREAADRAAFEAWQAERKAA